MSYFKNQNINRIRGCNFSIFKNDIIKVNGFNEGITTWGREDSEFIMRLLNSGINRKNIRFNAIQFHLWHNENIRSSLEKNDVILQEAINNHNQWCNNGIDSYL